MVCPRWTASSRAPRWLIPRASLARAHPPCIPPRARSPRGVAFHDAAHVASQVCAARHRGGPAGRGRALVLASIIARAGGRARRPARSRDAWELGPRDNQATDECAVRDWYCPVVFPESDGGLPRHSRGRRRGVPSRWRRGKSARARTRGPKRRPPSFTACAPLRGSRGRRRPSGSAPAAPRNSAASGTRPWSRARRRAHGPVRRARTVVGTNHTPRAAPTRVHEATGARAHGGAPRREEAEASASEPASKPEPASSRTRGSPRPSPVPTRPRSTPRRRDGSP